MRVLGIGGVPACGKSQLVTSILPILPAPRPYAWRTVRGEIRGDVLILGRYDGGPFPGTDRLSLAVQPDALRLLAGVRGIGLILFEGDRLFNAPFVRAAALADAASRFVILDAPGPELAARRAARPSRMADSFLSGRETKYRNLRSALGPPTLEIWASGDVSDLERNAGLLVDLIGRR